MQNLHDYDKDYLWKTFFQSENVPQFLFINLWKTLYTFFLNIFIPWKVQHSQDSNLGTRYIYFRENLATYKELNLRITFDNFQRELVEFSVLNLLLYFCHKTILLGITHVNDEICNFSHSLFSNECRFKFK